MKRRAFDLLSAISAALCIAIVVLWLRSYRQCDVLVAQHSPGDRVGVTSEFGRIVIELEARQENAIQSGWVYCEPPLPRLYGHKGGVLGFELYRGAVRHFLLLPPSQLTGATAPHLFFAVLAAIAPGTWLARHRRRKTEWQRRNAGLCLQCGYDLRGNPQRCSECGALAFERLRDPAEFC